MDIENDMKRYFDRVIISFTSVEDKLSLVELESRKRTILCCREKEARQKSRALWLLCGDDNTPFSINLLLIGKILILFGKILMILEI